jgi:hypothetical protein
MFYRCINLSSIPSFNLSNSTNNQYMFQNCLFLIYVPNITLNTSSNVNIDRMFRFCSSLKYIGQMNVTTATNLNYIFENCFGIQKSELINTRISISYANCSLSRAELVNIFTQLGTVSNQTITITSNPGTAELTVADRFIATSKGWTIVG